MNLTHLCGQLIVIGIPGTELSPSERQSFERNERGGIVLFKRNVEGGIAQIVALNESVRQACATDNPPLVAIDQEGGRVVRIGPPALGLPPMRTIGDLGDVDLARRLAEAQARELAAFGFTMSFAPVADVHTRPENPVIGNRAFASTPDAVVRFARAWAEGLGQGGLLTCAKHFPGHGDTTKDSHLELPRVERTREELEKAELAPFRALAKDASIDSMMVAHVVYPALELEGLFVERSERKAGELEGASLRAPSNEERRPASLSHAISTKLLRDELKFEGVLFTDDLEMKAIALPMGEAVVRAVSAGSDALLICHREDLANEAHEALVREAERSPAFRARCEEAHARFQRMRARRPPLVTTEAQALAAIESSKPIAAELAKRLA